jgi:hypothetical protein
MVHSVGVAPPTCLVVCAIANEHRRRPGPTRAHHSQLQPIRSFLHSCSYCPLFFWYAVFTRSSRSGMLCALGEAAAECYRSNEVWCFDRFLRDALWSWSLRYTIFMSCPCPDNPGKSQGALPLGGGGGPLTIFFSKYCDVAWGIKYLYING